MMSILLCLCPTVLYSMKHISGAGKVHIMMHIGLYFTRWTSASHVYKGSNVPTSRDDVRKFNMATDPVKE